LFVTAALLCLPASALADASGTFVYTKRFDGESVVLEVDWTYVREVPSLTFGEPRVIWSGAGAPEGQAGSDGLFYNPVGDLLVANWQSNAFWKFDPSKTDEVIEGPSDNALAFHALLHPNEDDFLGTNAFGQITCGDVACFGVYDHTPLDTTTICAAPLESATQDLLQPVTFIADENLNMFTIFSDGRDCVGCPEGTGIQFGGGGFASFELDTTTSTNCSGAMQMTRLIPQEISAAHSMSWDPFLSAANDVSDPHSDFVVFANSRLAHVRVDDPGSPGATAQVVSTVDMATEGSCASLLPEGLNEFDQGAVNGEGIALVGDEATGFIALIDYSQNNNGTMLDPENMVCLTSFLSTGIDDIAPLTGLGAKFFDGREFYINAGHAGAWFDPETSGQGQLIDVIPANQFMFLAWFTFTDAASSNPDEQHWYTAQGDYSGNTTEQLILSETLGGQFDDPQEVSTNPVGTVTVSFSDCDEGQMVYRIDTDGREGTIPLERLIPGSDDVCEEQSGTAATTEAVDINAGMDGTWVNNDTLGQGFWQQFHFRGLVYLW
jgi:hypothetical protein